MDRCPSCRARVDGADNCRRCGMSLVLLYKIEEAADARLATALDQLLSDDAAAAAASLRRLLALRRDPLAELLLGFAQTGPARPGRPPDNSRRPAADPWGDLGWSFTLGDSS